MHRTFTHQINILMNRYNPSSLFNSPESSFRTPKLNAGPVDTFESHVRADLVMAAHILKFDRYRED